MSMINGKGTTNVTDYKIDAYEYFNNVEIIPVKPTTIKAYIAKYMPYVSGGDWQAPYPISIGPIANAPECTVVFPQIVTEQGYVTLEHYPNELPDFTPKGVLLNGRLVVLPWNKFMAEVIYEDPTDIKFTGKV